MDTSRARGSRMRITPQGLTDTSGIGTGTAPVQESTRVEGTEGLREIMVPNG